MSKQSLPAGRESPHATNRDSQPACDERCDGSIVGGEVAIGETPGDIEVGQFVREVARQCGEAMGGYDLDLSSGGIVDAVEGPAVAPCPRQPPGTHGAGLVPVVEHHLPVLPEREPHDVYVVLSGAANSVNLDSIRGDELHELGQPVIGCVQGASNGVEPAPSGRV